MMMSLPPNRNTTKISRLWGLLLLSSLSLFRVVFGSPTTELVIEEKKITGTRRLKKKWDQEPKITEYDYYYPWDMHKYAPQKRAVAPVANPAHSIQGRNTGIPADGKTHNVKKKDLKSKKGGRGIGKNKIAKAKDTPRRGKGKGKGGLPDGEEMGCLSKVAELINDAVPEIVTRNPTSCCDFVGPQTVYVTHALKVSETNTLSGFESFWDQIYTEIARASDGDSICFVMTGINSESSHSSDEILLNANRFIRSIPDVISMMSTDPTNGVDLIQEIRSISNDLMAPSIGVFNAGYDNVVVESILSGKSRLPYIGSLDEASFGTAAASISMALLPNIPLQPICFNPRIGVVEFVGERCEAFYNAITNEVIQPPVGMSCSANSTPFELYDVIVDQSANAVWAHVDCCAAAASAVEIARRDGRTIIIGCQDEDTSGGNVDFVTTQPIHLQAYSVASWANFPVYQSLQGQDGRMEQFFPSLQSLVNTAIYNEINL